ncbi:MAG TPA: VIT1/CCC1 transporter family protein [Bryobacteraceae bacterium]|nr:VIT1/CCC1 transporter family protein [Bryobacteraceae bacterium]
MPQTPHVEKHFTASDFVRDVVIGMADGLTVPFALAAGLSGANITPRIIVVAGLAEIAAGSIAMGLGGYLAARNDADHYASELRREQREVEEIPDQEAREVLEVFETYGLTHAEAVPIVNSLRQRPKQWIDFMMRFELGLEEPDPQRAVRSASTIAGAYIAGGLIPLAPYMLMTDVYSALIASVAATLIALAIFGAIKGHYTAMPRVASAVRTVVIGGLAAAAAFGIARLVSSK